MRVIPQRGMPEEFISDAVFPSATSDGRVIVIQRDGLWRFDGDGRRSVQLSPDGFDPLVTPDDKRVIFLSNRTGTQSLWMQNLDGGTPTSIANVGVGIQSFAVSPDSRSLVFRSSCCNGERKEPTLVVCEFPGCATRRALPSHHYAGGRVRWTPDGRSLAYVDADTQSNIWIQPLDATAPRQLTHFTDRTITDFAWSHDGRQLAIARATSTNDIVLFRGLKR
jgi:Tol biopolymer transport system component